MKQWIITFSYSDGDTVKYIINKQNYIDVKHECESIINDNSTTDVIKFYDIKELVINNKTKSKQTTGKYKKKDKHSDYYSES